MNKGIAGFYDESSGLWERMWGEHMHHGYYPRDAAPKSNQQAQIDMIEEVLKWAGVTKTSKARLYITWKTIALSIISAYMYTECTHVHPVRVKVCRHIP